MKPKDENLKILRSPDPNLKLRVETGNLELLNTLTEHENKIKDLDKRIALLEMYSHRLFLMIENNYV